MEPEAFRLTFGSLPKAKVIGVTQLDVGAAAKPPGRAVLTPRMFSDRLSSVPTQNDINCVSLKSIALHLPCKVFGEVGDD